MTIFSSVGKYLYAGETREKIHLKSKDTQPSIQDNTFPTNQTQTHRLKGPPEQVTDLGQRGAMHNQL